MDSRRDIARTIARQNQGRDIPARFERMPKRCSNCEPEYASLVERIKAIKFVFSISPSHRFLISFRFTTKPIP